MRDKSVHMACMKSMRSKLASTQMTEEARILACILTYASLAKHTSLDSTDLSGKSNS